MVRRFSGRPIVFFGFALLAAIALAVPAAAQSTGIIRGTVIDDKGQPVEGAKIIIEMTGGTGRRFETKSDKKGEFLQVGLSTSGYSVKAEKDKLASAPVNTNTRANQTATVQLVLGVASAAASAEAQRQAAEIKKLFEDGVAASSAGNHAAAIEKFTAAAAIRSTCYDCYNNIGFSYSQTKEWDKAEAAYKKSIEIKADDAAAYSGLATVYNAQRKFDEAAAASKKATEYAGVLGAAGGAGGNASALYNQAVILFNQSKPAEAKPLLEQAVAADPNMADAHYLLGMTLVGIDPTKAVPEFEAFLKLSPNGPADKVKTANDIIAAFKK